MFGQQKPTFGQATTGTAFGGGFSNPATTLQPFGQSTFGKPAASTFGQTPAFGQQNTSLFGSNQTTGSLFGASSSSGAFGSTTNTQPTFGGFAQQAPNTSLFGTPQQSTQTPLFGQSNSAFGAAKPTGFGTFGQTQPTTSLFGQASTATTPATGFGTFGPTATGSVFGSTQPAFGQSLGGATGTAVVKYQPSIGTDTFMKNGTSNNVNTKQHCITAMKEYEGKSFEELRMEDYLANRKGPQGGTTGGLFGQTQSGASGVFGSTGTQQTTGLFGQQTENKNLFGATGTLGGAGFGQTSTPAFGQTNTTSTGLFAKPFSTPATSSTGFGFGGGTNLFGQTSQATGFGQTSTSFGGFGTAAQTQPSLFGSTNTTTNTFGLGTSTSNTGFGSFGTNTNTNTLSGGLFGNKPATGFGTGAGFGTSTSTATGFGGFGTSNAGGSLFSNTLAKPATSGFGGFGSQPAAPIGGGLNFGNTNTSLFGNTANKPGGSLFGNAAPGTGTNLFGSGSTFGATNTFGGFGTNTFGSSNTLGAPQQQTMSIHQHITALAASPYGDNPIFKDLKIKPSENDSLKATNPAAHKPILDAAIGQFKVSSKNVNGVKVKPVGGVLTKKSLFDGLEEYDSTLERSFTLKPNAKRLIIKPKEIKSPNILTLDDSTPKNTSNNQDKENQETNRNNEEIMNNSVFAKTQNMKQKMQSQNRSSSQSSPPNKDDFSHRESWLRKNDNVREQNRSNEQGETSPDNSLSELLPKASSTYVQVGGKLILQQQHDDNKLRKTDSLNNTSNDNSSINKSYDENRNKEPSLTNIEPHPTGIVLQRVGYYTIPTLDELIHYISEDGSCIVPNFTVGRHGYGNVFFNEPIDVAGLNLDEIVHFRHKEIILYPDDENKPPVGSGLNREAQITLDQVWPQDKTLHEPIKDPERLAAMDYEGKLRKVCDKHDTRFIEYRPETGSWVFKVKHFSKYGLNDSDEEDLPTDSKKPKMGPKELTAKEKEKALMGQKMASSSQQKKKSSGDVELSQFKDLQDDLAISKEYLRKDEINDLSAYTVSNSLLIPPTSPTEALARGSGMDAQKLQMMKASFFVEDDMDNRSIASESFDGRCTPDQTVPSSRLFLQNRDQYSSTQSLLKDTASSKSTIDYNIDSPGIPLTTIDEGSGEFEDEQITQIMAYQKIEPLIIKPKIASRKVTNPISYEDSVGLKLEGRCISDMSLYNLRRFKVGFGSQNNLLALNSLNQKINIFGIELKNNMMPQRYIISNNFAPLLHQIKITSARYYDNFEKTVENHLKIQLNHSLKVEVDKSDCPFMKSSCGTELLTKHLNESKNLQKLGDFEEYIASVWSLLQSLWGDQDELEGQNPLNHLSIMCRKNLFSEWLENELTIQKNDDIFTKTKTSSSSSNYLEHLFNLLTCHKVYDACELAFRNDDANLSLLLAQISGGPTIRQIIQHQLSSWQKVEADKYISIERLKIFMLIAGISLMSSSHGAINVLSEINWLKALAVHLWYLCSPTSSVTDVLLAYENSFNAEEFYSLPPTPSYYQKYDAKSANNRSLYDLKYHILKLYSKRSHPMESLLNPATHTDDPMDFRLSWFLLQTFEALGYHHCSELSETQLHISFANQLENNGMWYWSIFVLLHIKNKEKRELCVQEILYRYVNLLNTTENIENEKFIVNDLGVPQKWLYWAKAVKAGIYKNYRLQVDYLLKAKQFSLAHEIIMEHIAPDAIINDKIRDLYQLLIQFENQKSKKLEKVHNWSNRGQILLDYIEMDEKFKKLKTLHESDIETRWESLKPQLADLCSRINLLPCPTAKHRLCQSEIAQKLACLVRGILLTCPILNPCLLIKIALEKLPLPQEFAQQELRVLLDTLVEKMMKTNTLEEVENMK